MNDSATFTTYSDGNFYKRPFQLVKNWIKGWITKSDVGLGNVDNTADKNKAVKAVLDYNSTTPRELRIGYTGASATKDEIKQFAVFIEGDRIKDASVVESLKKLADATESRTDAWGDTSAVLGYGGDNGIYRRTVLSLYNYIKPKLLASESTFTGGETFQGNNFGTALIVNRNVAGGASAIAFKILGATKGYLGVDPNGSPAFWDKNTNGSILAFQNGNVKRLGGVDSLAGEIYYNGSTALTFSTSTGTFTLGGVKFYWRNEDVTTTISGVTKKLGKI